MPAPAERRSLILLGIFFVLMIVGGLTAWSWWGPHVASQPEFELRAEDISIPEQPSWIVEDVRATAIRDGNLEGLLVTDPSLVEQVESAFGVQTWVSKVVRIRKRPGPSVEVELEYRRPVALVEVLTEQGQRALQPIDADGYVLPEGFLHANTALIHEYPRISAGFSMPKGPVGTSWGDPQVAGAARICDVIQDHWKQLGIYRVVAVDGNPAAPGSTEYELQTRGGTRVAWGRTVGFEQPGETDNATKLRMLLHHANSQPLDANGPVAIDVRVARTARIP